MNREIESLLINRNQTIEWITKEISYVINQMEKMKRYQKVRHEGYLCALKKVQTKLNH